MIVILLGPPGSGKGTQAKKLSSEKGWPHLSTGDMLRSAISRESQLGREAKAFIDQGKLVPDEVVIGLIRERTEMPDCRSGFILDGFPRTIPQAEALEKVLALQGRSVDRAVSFEIHDEELIKRLSGRRTCKACGSMYHIENFPPKVRDFCDQCKGQLIQRSDDLPEVIQKRLAVYHQQTKPLIGYYRDKNKLKSLNAKQTTEEVASNLAEALK